MALSKITADSLGANAVTANAISNTAIIAALGFTPVSTSAPAAIANSSSNVAYFAANGNVGVGTSTPGSTFEVKSGSYSRFSVGSGLYEGVVIGRRVADDNYASLTFSAGGATSPKIEASGVNLDFYANNTMVGQYTSTGDFKFNSGYGSAATAYGCRAWVHFNGTNTISIRASKNVSSITDFGPMYYGINFTNPMPDGNYAWFANGSNVNDSEGTNFTGYSTTSPGGNMGPNGIAIRGLNIYNGGANQSGDCPVVTVGIFR